MPIDRHAYLHALYPPGLHIEREKNMTEEATPAPATEHLPASLPGLIEGQICHYVAYNGRHLAALVIGHDASKGYSQADLAVFTNMLNTNGVKNFGLQFHQDIPYSEEPQPGTWHWIEKS